MQDGHTPAPPGILAADDDDELWPMRDYFWAVSAELVDPSRQAWTSFRDGYAAMARAKIRHDRRAGLLVLTSLLILFATAAFAGEAGPARQKLPWQWTDEERIAARVDPDLARERVRAARSGQEPVPEAVPADIIDGSLTPELFLPVELFADLVTLGLVEPDHWREAWASGRKASGLPPDFWCRLNVVAEPYLSDLRRIHDLIERGRTLGSPERTPIEEEIASLQPLLCSERAAALAAARKEFGEALDRFLYETIAAGRAAGFGDYQSAEVLQALVRGCR